MADHWKSIANRLGAPGVDEPESESEGKQAAMEAGPIESDPAPPRDEPAGVAPPPKAAPKAPPVASSERDKPPTAKRKSSWESLASMFNVKVDRSPPADPDPVPELPAASPVEDTPAESPSTETPLSIFAESVDEANPALDAMFGDSPRESQPAGWGKTAPRVIDDLGWDEPETQEVASEAAEEDTDEDPPRRGRRRRRRGRRGRAETGETNANASPEPAAWDEPDLVEPPDVDEDTWEAPDTFAVDEPSEIAGDESEPELSFRRSNRRRRGRGSSPAADGPQPPRPAAGEGRSEGRGEGRNEGRADGGRAPRDTNSPRGESRSPEVRSGSVRRPEVEPEEDSGVDEAASETLAPRGRRRRRGGRGGEGERGREPVRDAPESTEDEFDSDDDTLSGGGKHRNIPTWSESIQSLVEANIENRRRSDSRGGPRGRPRGRR